MIEVKIGVEPNGRIHINSHPHLGPLLVRRVCQLVMDVIDTAAMQDLERALGSGVIGVAGAEAQAIANKVRTQ